MVKVKKVESLEYKELPLHWDMVSREVWGPNTGSDKIIVMYNTQYARGGAEMHVHEKTEHIFIVLKGNMNVKTDKDEDQFGPGDAFVILPGEPHAVTSVGDSDCIWLCITTPPPNYNETQVYKMD